MVRRAKREVEIPFRSQAQRAAFHIAAEGKGNLGIPKSVADKWISEDKPGKLPYHVKKAEGGLAGFAAGGGLTGEPSPVESRGPGTQLAREIHMPNGGFLNSGIAGRTDRIPASVASDSFVMPADVVSGLGQGNSLAGARILSKALKMGPWGTELPAHGARGRGPPSPPDPYRPHAEGGLAANDNQAKVLVAGGEFSIPPEVVQQLGGGDLKKGHAVLRRMVDVVRKAEIARLKTAPKPKRSMGGSVSLGLAA